MADFGPETVHYNDNTMIFNLETKKALPLPFDNIKIIGISPSWTKIVYIQFAIFYQIFVYDTRTNKIDLISATKLVKNLDFLAWSVDESYLHMIDLESYELVMLSMKNNRLDYREMF